MCSESDPPPGNIHEYDPVPVYMQYKEGTKGTKELKK